jgi:hypothetical protein
VTGAVALAVVLVIAVAGLSMAMQGQRTAQSSQGGPRQPRPPRPSRPTMPTRRPRERRAPTPPPPPPPVPFEPAEAEVRGPELLRSGIPADAKVISVVDERTIGPVTRSRLTLEVTPKEGDTFEVTTRVAFPTAEARSRVKVGGTVPVRYDKDDRTRIVVDLPPD